MRRYAYKKPPVVWTSELAYVVGLIVTDGNLSPSGRHISITSKDKEIVLSARRTLKLKSKIGMKGNGASSIKRYHVLQFGDTRFYDFLLSIGLTPAKSKTLKNIDLPNEYFADFLRGCIDGDGSIGSFMHPESMLPQHKVRLVSASPLFLKWMLDMTRTSTTIAGGSIHAYKNSSIYCLLFCKKDAEKILRFMYYSPSIPSLGRKKRVALKILDTLGA